MTEMCEFILSVIYIYAKGKGWIKIFQKEFCFSHVLFGLIPVFLFVNSSQNCDINNE